MILGILSFKGGQGKTTSAMHLAGFLAERASTVLIDADINESALIWARKSELLKFTVVPEEETASVARKFEHIVIDSAARPAPNKIQSIVKNCDLIVCPVTPDALSLTTLRMTIDSIKNLPKEKYRVLLTQCPPYPSHDPQDARQMIERSGLPIFSGQIRRAVAFTRAPIIGGLVGDVADPRSAECAEDYQSIGEEILNLVN